MELTYQYFSYLKYLQSKKRLQLSNKCCTDENATFLFCFLFSFHFWEYWEWEFKDAQNWYFSVKSCLRKHLLLCPFTCLQAVYIGSHMEAACEGVKMSSSLTPQRAALKVLLCHKHNNPPELKAWCLSHWSPGCRRKAGCTWLSSFCWWQSEKKNGNDSSVLEAVTPSLKKAPVN